MYIKFTDQQEYYIASQVALGDYQNASDVVRNALQLHERYRYNVLESLQTAIDSGWSGSPSPHSVADIMAGKTATNKTTRSPTG